MDGETNKPWDVLFFDADSPVIVSLLRVLFQIIELRSSRAKVNEQNEEITRAELKNK